MISTCKYALYKLVNYYYYYYYYYYYARCSSVAASFQVTISIVKNTINKHLIYQLKLKLFSKSYESVGKKTRTLHNQINNFFGEDKDVDASNLIQAILVVRIIEKSLAIFNRKCPWQILLSPFLPVVRTGEGWRQNQIF